MPYLKRHGKDTITNETWNNEGCFSTEMKPTIPNHNDWLFDLL